MSVFLSKSFVADENRLDKDVEDERNNKVGLSLEMNDEEVNFPKKEKEKEQIEEEQETQGQDRINRVTRIITIR